MPTPFKDQMSSSACIVLNSRVGSGTRVEPVQLHYVVLYTWAPLVFSVKRFLCALVLISAKKTRVYRFSVFNFNQVLYRNFACWRRVVFI